MSYSFYYWQAILPGRWALLNGVIFSAVKTNTDFWEINFYDCFPVNKLQVELDLKNILETSQLFNFFKTKLVYSVTICISSQCTLTEGEVLLQLTYLY